jgi:membrane protease YdiL (CAAX protease family)
VDVSGLGRLLAPDGDGHVGPRPAGWRVAAWVALVAILAAAGYAVRFTGGTPDRDALYKTGTGVGAIIQDAFMLALVLGIAGSIALLALRHPRSWWRALGLAVLVLVVIALISAGLESILHAGKEQGLTPDRWDPTRSGAYTFNFIVIAAFVPIVEEITFRGVGFSLLRRWGTPVAVIGTAVAFALAHGLVQGFPTLLIFGLGLAWLRLRTDSVYPGIAVHAAFNTISLIAAVTT